MILEENDLKFIFPERMTGFVFDQPKKDKPNYHDKENMARVDLIVEDAKVIYFIEVKDPGHPNATAENYKEFCREIAEGKLIISLFNKFWNTFVFRWAEECLTKDVAYLCVMSLDDSMTVQLTEELQQRLKNLKEKSSRWKKHPLIHCQVLNLDAWNSFSPEWKVERISEGN